MQKTALFYTLNLLWFFCLDLQRFYCFIAYLFNEHSSWCFNTMQVFITFFFVLIIHYLHLGCRTLGEQKMNVELSVWLHTLLTVKEWSASVPKMSQNQTQLREMAHLNAERQTEANKKRSNVPYGKTCSLYLHCICPPSYCGSNETRCDFLLLPGVLKEFRKRYWKRNHCLRDMTWKRWAGKNKKAVNQKRRGEKRREGASERASGIKDEMLSADNPFTPKHTLRYWER